MEGKSLSFLAKPMFWGAFALLILVGGGVFYLNSHERTLAVINIKLPVGVFVSDLDRTQKKITNQLDGYEVAIFNKISTVDYEGGVLKVTELSKNKKSEEGGYTPQYFIGVNQSETSLEVWVQDWIMQQEFSDEYFLEKGTYNNIEYILVKIPSFADSEKILFFKKNHQILFINTYLINPLDVLKNITLI